MLYAGADYDAAGVVAVWAWQRSTRALAYAARRIYVLGSRLVPTPTKFRKAIVLERDREAAERRWKAKGWIVGRVVRTTEVFHGSHVVHLHMQKPGR